jgi:outer membrane lipoprotein-sorting protein
MEKEISSILRKDKVMLERAIRKMVGLLLLVALLAGVLVTGGCAKKPTAEDIVAKMQEVMDSTDDAHAVVEVTAAVQGESVRVTVEMWGKRPNKVRVEVLETDRAELGGAVTVTDGQTAWFYSPMEGQVVVGDVSEMPDTTPEEIIQDMDGFIQRVLDASDVELLGEEEVAGVETYKLSLTPKEDEEQQLPVTGTATLWVDQSEWIVLKAHLDAPNIGEGTVEVRSFELNSGLEDEVFTFEVPEGTEIVHAEDTRPQHVTLDEAIAQADFDLLMPDYLPGGATLVDVMKVQGAFVLLYDREGATFTLAQSLEELPSEFPVAGEMVTVRGVEANLIADQVGGASLLAWQEKGVNFTIAGHIGKDEAIEVAESLK